MHLMEPWGPLYHRTSGINRNESTESNRTDCLPSPIEPQNSAKQKNLNSDFTNNSDETTGFTMPYKPTGHIVATRFNWTIRFNDMMPHCLVQDPISLPSQRQLKY